MATNYSEKTQSTSGSIREASERFAREAREQTGQVSEMMGGAREKAGEFYDQASTWVSENYGKSIAAVAVLAAVGVLGYMIGRGSRSEYPEI